MEEKKAKIVIIEFSNRDIITSSKGGLVDNGNGSYSMPETPLP